MCTEKQLDCTNSKKKFKEYLNSKPNFGGICVAMLYYSCIEDLFVQMNFKLNSKCEKGVELRILLQNSCQVTKHGTKLISFDICN